MCFAMQRFPEQESVPHFEVVKFYDFFEDTKQTKPSNFIVV